MERIELRLSDGQRVVVELEDDRVALRVGSAVLLTLSRPDAWKLAEALDTHSTQA